MAFYNAKGWNVFALGKLTLPIYLKSTLTNMVKKYIRVYPCFQQFCKVWPPLRAFNITLKLKSWLCYTRYTGFLIISLKQNTSGNLSKCYPYPCDSLKSVDTIVDGSLNVVHIIVCWAANYDCCDATLLSFYSEDDDWRVSQLINKHRVCIAELFFGWRSLKKQQIKGYNIKAYLTTDYIHLPFHTKKSGEWHKCYAK